VIIKGETKRKRREKRREIEKRERENVVLERSQLSETRGPKSEIQTSNSQTKQKEKKRY